MSNLFNTVLQTLKDRLPNTSWKVGSLVRELLVEPLMYIGKAVDDKLAEIIKTENLSAALADPLNNEDALDVWMSRLRINVPEPRQASGTVHITFTGSEILTISSGTVFTWGDNIRVRSTKFVEVNPLVPSDSLRQLAGGFYVVEVPVETTENASYTLSCGAKLNWTEASNRIMDICVNTPINGGIAGLTAAEKARLITAKLESSNMCGEQSILNALINEFGSAVCSIRLESRVRTGDSLCVPIYVKQSTPASHNKITLTKKSTGIYTGSIGQLISVKSVWTPDGWPRQFSVEYKSDGVVEVVVEGEDARTLTAEVLNLDQSANIESWLNSRQCGAPTALKIMTPAYCELSIDIPGMTNIPTSALSAVSAHINSIGFDATITDKDINAILNDYGVQTSRALTYTAVVTYHNFVRKVVQTGSISLDGLQGLGNVPVAVYCSVNKIRNV